MKTYLEESYFIHKTLNSSNKYNNPQRTMPMLMHIDEYKRMNLCIINTYNRCSATHGGIGELVDYIDLKVIPHVGGNEGAGELAIGNDG